MKVSAFFRSIAVALALAAGVIAAVPQRADAGDIRVMVYNVSPNKAWITIYRADIGKKIVCSGWAPSHGWKECNPWFISSDTGMWVRAEIVNGSDKVIRDIEINGSPRTLRNSTVRYENGDFRITVGAP